MKMTPRPPDILCVGAQKAGTSWLHIVLGKHPQIWVPPFKETHYFDHRMIEAHREWIPRHFQNAMEALDPEQTWKGLDEPGDMVRYYYELELHEAYSRDWYHAVFGPARPDQLAMDVTPAYGLLDADGVAQVRQEYPDLKIIIMVRDPVDRAISQLRMLFRRIGRETPSMDQWKFRLNDPAVLRQCDYKANFPHWLKQFGDAVLALPFGQLTQEPDALLGRITSHLGIEDAPPLQRVQKIHEGRGASAPDAVREILKDRLAPQYAYLTDTFGADFCKEI